MPIIHGKQINFGEVTLFTPDEILKSWHSADGLIYQHQGCQYCSTHGRFRCDICCWVECSCNSSCEYSTDWSVVIANKRADNQYKSLLKRLSTEGFVIPLNVVWREGLSPKHGDGNHRFSAALELGFSVIPYIVSESILQCRRGTDGWSIPPDELDNPVYIDTPIPEELLYMKRVFV